MADLSKRGWLQLQLNQGLKHSAWWNQRLLEAVRARLPADVGKKIVAVRENIGDNSFRICFNTDDRFVDIPAKQLPTDAAVARICLECP